MSKRIGNIKRLLVAMGIGFLSVCTLNQMASAAPAGEVKHYRTDGLTGVVRYEIELTETTAGGEEQHYLNRLYYMNGQTEVTATVTAGSISGDVSSLTGGGKKETANVVVEVPNTVTELIVANDNGVPATSTIKLYSGEEAVFSEGVLTNFAGILDNDAPVLCWAYKNVEGNYIQFKAEDAAVLVDKILDDNGKDRVIIQEKEKSQEVIAKYKLKTGDKKFYVVDRLGNKLEVDIEDDVKVEYTLAAKDIEGSRVVLNMTLPEGAEFTSITTVEGNEISDTASIDFRKTNDNLVAIYTDVPEGTTYVNVNYKLNSEDKTIPVELDLDLSCPELVSRNVDGDGEITQTGGLLRAYKNYDSTMAIVEVKDMVSGITKIAAAIGDEESKVESKVESSEEPGVPTNEAFRIEGLPTSVVQLIKLPQGATHIRVHDGIDNVQSIDLNNVPVVYGNTIEVGDAGMELELKRDGDDVHAIYRSRKAGLKKFVKVTPAGAQESRAISIVLSEKSGEPAASALENAATAALAVWDATTIASAKTAADSAVSDETNAQAIIAARAAAEAATEGKTQEEITAAGDAAVAAKTREIREAAARPIIIAEELDAKDAAKTILQTGLAGVENSKVKEQAIVFSISAERKEAVAEALAKLIAYKAEQAVIDAAVADTEVSNEGAVLDPETVKIAVKEVDAVLKLVTSTDTTGTCTTDGDREYMIDASVTNGSDNIFAPIQTTNDIKTWYPVTEQTRDIKSGNEEPSLITISGSQLQLVPEYVAVDVFGNTSLFNLNDILFKAGVQSNTNDDDNHYIYINADGSGKTNLISVKVEDVRRVKKITATIDDKEKTLETFEIDVNPDAVGNRVSTQDVDRVYEIRKGAVSKVTVYHWNDRQDHNEHYNGVTQNEVVMKDYNKIGADDRVGLVKITKDQTNSKYNVAIKYGIKRIDYSDGTVLEFYDEIPKKVDIFAKDASNNSLTVTVTDALGYTYGLGEGNDAAALSAYGPEAETQTQP